MAHPVKVAVVGSGLAGLTAAFLLSTVQHQGDDAFECHVFEKSDEIGIDSSSISLDQPSEDGRSHSELRIDVPMRSFQGGYYRELIKLYDSMGIQYHQRDFSYSFSEASKDKTITTSMIYNGDSGRAGVGIPSAALAQTEKHHHNTWSRIFNKWLTLFSFALSTLILLFNYLRLAVLSAPFLRPSGTLSLREWSQRTTPTSFPARRLGLDKSWQKFTGDILVPLFSAVCTATREDVLSHPVEELLEYVWLTLGTHHYVATHGVRDVARRMAGSIRHIHLGSPITSIKPDRDIAEAATIVCSTADGLVEHSGFRHVVLATTADAAADLVRNYSQAMKEASESATVLALVACLEQFTYRSTVVVNHADESLLPNSSRDWRDINLVFAKDDNTTLPVEKPNLKTFLPTSYTMATHILPEALYNLRHRIMQTTNPIMPARDGSVLSVSHLPRAVVTARSKVALEQLSRSPRRWWDVTGKRKSFLGALQGLSQSGGPRIWVCGSYAWGGIPLLEGCVRSAQDVVEQGILQAEGLSKSLPQNNA